MCPATPAIAAVSSIDSPASWQSRQASSPQNDAVVISPMSSTNENGRATPRFRFWIHDTTPPQAATKTIAA